MTCRLQCWAANARKCGLTAAELDCGCGAVTLMPLMPSFEDDSLFVRDVFDMEVKSTEGLSEKHTSSTSVEKVDLVFSFSREVASAPAKGAFATCS